MPESTGYAVKNNAESTVADNPLTSSATTLNVAAGQGSRFPSTFPFLVTIWDDVTHPDPTDDPNMEITECSARSSDALTILRGKEDTSGVEHANGSRVAMLITAGIFNDPTYGISTKLNGIEDNATADQTKADIDALGINAGQVDGCDAGADPGDVFLIPSNSNSGILYEMWYGSVTPMYAGDEGKRLTSHGNDSPLTWETPSEGGVTDHGDLTGLADDDHTQYLLASGARVMSGDLDIGNNEILHCNRITAGDNEQLNMYGGDPYGSAVAVQPYNAAMYPGQILFVVPNATHDAHRVPMLIDGNTDTPIVDIYYGLNMGNHDIYDINTLRGYAGTDLKFYDDVLCTDGNPVTLSHLAAGGYTHPSTPACQAATSSVAGHATTTQISKLDGIANNANNYSHPSAPACQAATSSVAGHATTTQISKLDGIEAGATADQTKADIDALGINADQVDGCDAGIATGNVYKIPALSGQDGNCVKVNSEGTALELGACGTGGGVTDHGDLTGLADDDHTQYLLADGTRSVAGDITFSGAGRKFDAPNDFWVKTNGSTLVRLGNSAVIYYGHGFANYDNTYEWGDSAVRWSDIYCVTLHQGDTAFAEKTCAKCGKAFEVGDNIILKVTKIDDDTVTIPIHLGCANAPSKKITVKKRKMKNEYVIDEITGEVKTKQVPELIDKTVIKHKLREGYEFDDENGKVYKLNKDGTRSKTKCDLSTAIEAVEETISEVVYENVEFEI